MTRKLVVLAGLLSAALVWAGPAAAQERRAGAGRVEVGAIPVGGVMFLESTTANEPKFKNYTLGASATFNANRWVGVEGEFGLAVGIRQNFSFNGDALVDHKTPN